MRAHLLDVGNRVYLGQALYDAKKAFLRMAVPPHKPSTDAVQAVERSLPGWQVVRELRSGFCAAQPLTGVRRARSVAELQRVLGLQASVSPDSSPAARDTGTTELVRIERKGMQSRGDGTSQGLAAVVSNGEVILIQG